MALVDEGISLLQRDLREVMRMVTAVCQSFEGEVSSLECVAWPLLLLAAQYAERAHDVEVRSGSSESFDEAVARVRHNIGVEMARVRARRGHGEAQ